MGELVAGRARCVYIACDVRVRRDGYGTACWGEVYGWESRTGKYYDAAMQVGFESWSITAMTSPVPSRGPSCRPAPATNGKERESRKRQATSSAAIARWGHTNGMLARRGSSATKKRRGYAGDWGVQALGLIGRGGRVSHLAQHTQERTTAGDQLRLR